MKLDHVELRLYRSDRGYVFESNEQKISIRNSSRDAVIDLAVRLVSELVSSGTSCRIEAYESLGPGLRLLRNAGAICRVGLRSHVRPKRNAGAIRPIDPNERKPVAKLAGLEWQMPGMPTPEPPPPIYASWMDYLRQTTRSQRMVRCYAAAKKANRKRMLSDAPTMRLSGGDVWAVIEAAQGLCAHCGSLAVESRPSGPNGAPVPWAQVGRRVGSLEHVNWRYGGGGNDLSNLAWACLWCNTWPSERRLRALDHGGFYPIDDGR
jgi:hypothetical protein